MSPKYNLCIIYEKNNLYESHFVLDFMSLFNTSCIIVHQLLIVSSFKLVIGPRVRIWDYLLQRHKCQEAWKVGQIVTTQANQFRKLKSFDEDDNEGYQKYFIGYRLMTQYFDKFQCKITVYHGKHSLFINWWVILVNLTSFEWFTVLVNVIKRLIIDWLRNQTTRCRYGVVHHWGV